jgi:hypothetical protein
MNKLFCFVEGLYDTLHRIFYQLNPIQHFRLQSFLARLRMFTVQYLYSRYSMLLGVIRYVYVLPVLQSNQQLGR